MNLPEQYLENMKELLGTDFDAYIESFNDSRLYGLRVNTMKISVEDFLKISPFKLTPIPWIENGFYYSEDDKPAKHPYYFAGLYYIQEPSAMTPANVLPVEEGDIVFDMCAAPGGKSTELGAKLNGSGLLVTNDISNSRAKALLKNVEVFGIPNVYVVSEDPKNIQPGFNEFFDKILIDAPCSGEGMFRKDSKLRAAWEQNGPDFYSKIQKEIVGYAADLLKPGGMMVYSTCTFNELENEGTLISLLSSRDDMELVDIPKEYGFYPGRTLTEDQKKYHMERAVRVYPFALKGEGHFVSLLKKKGESVPGAFSSGTSRAQKLSDEFAEFKSRLGIPLSDDRIRVSDGKVYLLPEREFAGASRKIRYLRNGLLLGEEKKKRFEPSQALAMALKACEFDNVISLPADDLRVERYLKGETLNFEPGEINAKDGFVLFCVSGFPLGWGKLSGNVMKNKYLPGWRKA